MMATPHWRENALRKLMPSDGVLVSRKDWTSWVLSSTDKFEGMNIDYFIASAEGLVLTNYKFEYLVAHPAPDVLNSPEFKKKVITYFMAHGMEFSTTAYTLNQTSAWTQHCSVTAVLLLFRGNGIDLCN
eukprot:371581-Rhodomonas_salina.2